MFGRSDLGTPPDAPPPYQNRAIGALVLLVCVAFLIILALSADATLFIPFNATYAVTQTYQAAHPTTGTPTPRSTPRPSRGRPTPVPNNPDLQQARASQTEGERAETALADSVDSL